MDDLPELPIDPEAQEEWNAADAVLRTLKDVESKEHMGVEVLVEFIRNIRKGAETRDALWSALVEWDL